jgi:hypothetical protein
MKRQKYNTVNISDKNLIKEYVSQVINERTQSADVQVRTNANTFKSDIEFRDIKEAGMRLLDAIRGIIGDAIAILGTLVSTGMAFGELAFNGIGKLFGQPPKTDSILLSQRETFNKFKAVGDIVKGKQASLGGKGPDTLDQIKNLIGESLLEENIKFGHLLMEQAVAKDQFIDSVASSVNDFVNNIKELQAGGKDVEAAIEEISNMTGGAIPKELIALRDRKTAGAMSGEDIELQDLEKMKSHISDNIIPSLMGPFAVSYLSDAASKITAEVAEEYPEIGTEISEIYNKAISEFK